MRDSLLAFVEGRGGGLRDSLRRWLEARVRLRPLWRELALAAGLGAVAAALAMSGGGQRAPSALPSARADHGEPSLSLTARVVPPPYAGQEPVPVTSDTVQVLRGSELHLEVRSSGPVELTEAGGAPVTLSPGGGARVTAMASTIFKATTAAADGAVLTRILTVDVRADEPPRVDLVSPAADQVVEEQPAPVAIAAVARDDLGLGQASVHYTLAQGSGDAMRFTSGTFPARVKRTGATELTLEARADPAALRMGPGDTLVVWAEASDGNAVDGPSRTRSTARLIRWEVPVVTFTGSSAAQVPPPRSLLTQRELLARTERLVASGVTGARLVEGAQDLAQDQRSIRMSFGQLLSEHEGDAIELDVDDHEAVEATNVRSRALLAEAVSAMWDAEAELLVNRPRAALAPMRLAVKKLDEAMALVRMSLRPLAAPDKVVDERRRLSGAQDALRPGSRPLVPPPPPDARLLELARALAVGARRGLAADEARALADALWAASPPGAVPTAELAARLYGAGDSPSRTAASLTAARALALALRPARLRVPVAGPRLPQ